MEIPWSSHVSGLLPHQYFSRRHDIERDQPDAYHSSHHNLTPLRAYFTLKVGFSFMSFNPSAIRCRLPIARKSPLKIRNNAPHRVRGVTAWSSPLAGMAEQRDTGLEFYWYSISLIMAYWQWPISIHLAALLISHYGFRHRLRRLHHLEWWCVNKYRPTRSFVAEATFGISGQRLYVSLWAN